MGIYFVNVCEDDNVPMYSNKKSFFKVSGPKTLQKLSNRNIIIG